MSDLDALRRRIAESVAAEKAYDVPVLCSRLGLGEGSTDDAMRSKQRYVQSRIGTLTGFEVTKVAAKLQKIKPDFFL